MRTARGCGEPGQGQGSTACFHSDTPNPPSPQVLAAAPGFHPCPGPRRAPTSPGEVLKDFGGLHPAFEAGPTLLPDLLAPFVGDDLPTGLQDHKLGGGCDAVPGPQLTAERRGQARGQRGGEAAATPLKGPCAPSQPCTALEPRPWVPCEPPSLLCRPPQPVPEGLQLGCSGLCCPRPWHRHRGQRGPHNVAAVTSILVHFNLRVRSHVLLVASVLCSATLKPQITPIHSYSSPHRKRLKVSGG